MPFKLYPNNSNFDDDSYVCEIPDLTDDNYLSWAFVTRTALGVIGWGHFLKAEDNLQDSSAGKQDGGANQVDLDREIVRYTLLQCIGPKSHYYHQYNTTDDSPDTIKDPAIIWSSIRESERARFTPWTLRTQISNTTLSTFPGVREYISSIDRLIHRLEFSKSTETTKWEMPEDEVTFWYLHGLPESWDEHVLNLKIGNIGLKADDKGNLMYHRTELMWTLLRFEDIMIRERDKKKKCFKCNRYGHIQRNCLGY